MKLGYPASSDAASLSGLTQELKEANETEVPSLLIELRSPHPISLNPGKYQLRARVPGSALLGGRQSIAPITLWMRMLSTQQTAMRSASSTRISSIAGTSLSMRPPPTFSWSLSAAIS
ncbi:uncharacterized protein ATNIH1004_004510 [Aspergillus tanneri]|uniref:Uncharacterized protein n=1 Tax=Aspergillus tanneri TaxID=1220188 RepID=A0A5M9MNM5_9EURO|nr:uncharacterized protein ATNIH1004_004510 [Aspergillus tanneri]KAA8648625.1 hypothetical protein ATNIH1004_004510 [Aspergillus tanneri]